MAEPGQDSNIQNGRRANADRQYHAPQTPASRIVAKPKPMTQTDQRQFQLDQVRRRFSPKESLSAGNAILEFRLIPSDPDFPYEISALECILCVPTKFPVEKASLRVANKEMGRGYQINVEKGFQLITESMPRASLLQQLYALDKELEKLLAAPKAETVKIVTHAREVPDISNKTHVSSQEAGSSSAPAQNTEPSSIKPIVSVPSYSEEELAKARQTRKDHIRQFEARMGRLPLFTKSSDGVSYIVPVQPRRAELAASLKTIQRIKLIVPERYNLDPCQIELLDVSGVEVGYVQQNFRSLVDESPGTNLFSLVNKVSQTMHIMAKAPYDMRPTSQTSSVNVPQKQDDVESVQEILPLRKKEITDHKDHIIIIPKPPEWDLADKKTKDQGEEDSSSWDDDTDDDDIGNSSEEDHADANTAAHRPERGILVSFPHLELYGIELMELITLSITIKCTRCKEITDVKSIRDSSDNPSLVTTVVCRRCSSQMIVGYRMDLMHTNCIRAGYLDLDGCTVVDLLPSFFKPTCSICSTPYLAPGVSAVRGDSSLAVCRECHKRMSFKIPEVKFLQVSATTVRASQAPPKKRETLGIRAGEQLPNRGRCSHYAKSYRWFRFSCCSKVFPCDKCHDTAEDHPNEHANRMICGWCSREQNYKPEACGICHSSLIAKKRTGFWEGGTGTRSKDLMSRKDPRKYKRRPGTAPKVSA